MTLKKRDALARAVISSSTEPSVLSRWKISPNRLVAINKVRKTDRSCQNFLSKRRYAQALTVEKRRDGMLMVKIGTAGTTAIPVVLLMRALGVENDQQLKPLLNTDSFKLSLQTSTVNDNEEYKIVTTEESHHVGKKFAGQQKEYRETRKSAADRELLLTSAQGRPEKKAIYLAALFVSVEMAIEGRAANDQDTTPTTFNGDLIEDLLSFSWTTARDLKCQLNAATTKRTQNTSCLRPMSHVEDHARTVRATGSVADPVESTAHRTTYLAALSHAPRHLPACCSHPAEARDSPTQWGRLCPNETPEGQNCGLVKNAAQMIDISEDINEIEIRERPMNSMSTSLTTGPMAMRARQR